MVDTERETWTEEAYALGQVAATSAATWCTDGNTDPDVYRETLRLMADGDDVSERLPRMPNLSGEYADDPTPWTLYHEITGEDAIGEELDTMQTLAEEYERGVSDVFEDACETELRNALGLPNFGQIRVTESARIDWIAKSDSDAVGRPPAEHLRAVLERLALDTDQTVSEDYLEIQNARWDVSDRIMARVQLVLGTGGPHVELNGFFSSRDGRCERVQLDVYWSGHEYAYSTDTRALEIVDDWCERFLGVD